MPRRNRQFLVAAAAVCFLCYVRAGLADRDRYGQMVMQALAEIKYRYLEPIDQEALFEGAMQGLVGKLDDFSEYIDRPNFALLQEELDQAFGGVGIQVMLDDETHELLVATPLVGTPAFEAGIRAGDKILEIDGESTEGFRPDDAKDRLRGEPGQPVRVVIRHAGEDESRTLEIVRAMIETETVMGDTREPDGSWNFLLAGADRVGYLRILPMFSEYTADEVADALEWLGEREVEGLILDLRHNPGGLLESAVDVCDLFISQGVIVSTRGRDGLELEEYWASEEPLCPDLPLVVLINEHSASASEIVAACLQDHKRATLVGERTFGKGSVQDLIPLGNEGRALRLTTSSYWRPSGRNIHRSSTSQSSDPWGVLPDPGCEVSLEGEVLEKSLKLRHERDIVRPSDQPPAAEDLLLVDPQLQKAVEVVRAAALVASSASGK